MTDTGLWVPPFLQIKLTLNNEQKVRLIEGAMVDYFPPPKSQIDNPDAPPRGPPRRPTR